MKHITLLDVLLFIQILLVGVWIGLIIGAAL